MSIDMKKVEKVMAELNGDITTVKRELKRLQSIKCRLKKQKTRADYQIRMTECLQREQLVKECRRILEPKKVSVPDMTQSDINDLDFEATMKAIKSIQSKKCLSQGDEAEYQKACQVEKMLLEHKKQIKPVDETSIKKSELKAVIESIKILDTTVKRDTIIEMLEKLM